MEKNRVLLINTQFVEYYVSGFTNRFIGLWCYLQKNKQKYSGEIHWLTNKSLWDKYFRGKAQPQNVTIISADLRFFRYTSRLFYPFLILFIYYKKKCTSIHVATSIIDSLYLVRLFNLFRVPYCFTFASNSLEMASYNSDRMKKKWEKLFAQAKNIEVLNPTNTIDNYRGNKFVSPTSFPYITQFNDIPDQRFTNAERANCIVFCGTFVSQKNPMLALKGFEWYLENCVTGRPDVVKLKMIGRGELLAEVKEEIKRINERFDGNFVELVPENKLLETLSTSRIFLSLQDYDNYPSQSLMEAMLFCNSVIATNYGDTSKLVHASKNNALIEKDPALLGKAIEMLLHDWQLNIANKKLIDEQFSAGVFTDYFFQLHRQIASEN